MISVESSFIPNFMTKKVADFILGQSMLHLSKSFKKIQISKTCKVSYMALFTENLWEYWSVMRQGKNFFAEDLVAGKIKYGNLLLQL